MPVSAAVRAEVARRVAGHNHWVRTRRFLRHVNGASALAAAAGLYSFALPTLFVASIPWAMGTVWSNLLLRDALDMDPDARLLLPHADPTREIELRHADFELHPASPESSSAHDLCMAIVARRDRADV
jgi:hypothetical protein